MILVAYILNEETDHKNIHADRHVMADRDRYPEENSVHRRDGSVDKMLVSQP